MGILVSFVFIFLGFLYGNHRENEYKKLMERLVNRKIKYRGYCGYLRFSSSSLKYTCTFAGIQTYYPQENFCDFKRAKPDDVWEVDGSTETEALERFYERVDSILYVPFRYDSEADEIAAYAEEKGYSFRLAFSLKSGERRDRQAEIDSDRRANACYRRDVYFN